jgi:hypothetical protein
MLLNAIYTRQHNEKSEAFFLLPTIEKTMTYVNYHIRSRYSVGQNNKHCNK